MIEGLPRKAPDIRKYRAVLVEWSLYGIGEYRTIFYAKNSYDLLVEVSEAVINGTDVLYDHYWEYINVSELDILHEQFSEGVYPEDGWDYEDVKQLLKALIKERQDQLPQSSAEESILGAWYDLVEWINEISALNEDVSYMRIPVEDQFPHFISGWHQNELFWYSLPLGCRSIEDGTWRTSERELQLLGQLAVLNASPDWSNMHDAYDFVTKMIKEFNEIHEFH